MIIVPNPFGERPPIRNPFPSAAEAPWISQQMPPQTAEAIANVTLAAPGGSNLTALLTGSPKGALERAPQGVSLRSR